MPDKQPWEWEKADIEQMIAAQKQEDINLDYKSSDSLDKTDGKKKEITKDISAFANSDGGVVIYGVTENPTHRDLPEKIDAGSDPGNISKEWLEEVINSGVKPKMEGLRIKSITIGSNRVIYVVYVPKSTTAHQASDKRYYRRYNFQSVMMEHYEILDVLNRSILPDLQPFFSLTHAEGGQFQLRVCLINRGANVIKNISLELTVPTDLSTGVRGESTGRLDYKSLTLINNVGPQTWTFRATTFRSKDGEFVIFPKEEFEFISHNKLRQVNIMRSPQNPLLFMRDTIFWQLYADNMPVKNGEVIPNALEVVHK